jgi:hypothetical protein
MGYFLNYLLGIFWSVVTSNEGSVVEKIVSFHFEKNVFMTFLMPYILSFAITYLLYSIITTRKNRHHFID